jgi:hypothetical protein
VTVVFLVASHVHVHNVYWLLVPAPHVAPAATCLCYLQGSAAAAAAAAGRRHRQPPRLTASNFRFFLRGRSSKASAGDVVVSARRRANLAPYDRALRAFRYG